MVHLTLAGLSEDGKRLLLVSDAGVEFTLDVDDKLRAALRGDHARFGQLEIKMESVLRPRDIQARIRAGETPEAVAAAAQTSVDKIMPYAAPVLAEREHVAQRAQRASIRRPASSGAAPAGSRTLGDAVAGHLRAQNIDPGVVDWDAWRREDGRWTLTALFRSEAREGEAAFTFDAPGNYVSADDDDARWLIGDTVAGPAPQRPVAGHEGATTTWPRRGGVGWPPYPLTSSRSATTPSTWSARSRRPSTSTTRLPRPTRWAPRPRSRPTSTSPTRCRGPPSWTASRTTEPMAEADAEADARAEEPAGRPARRKGRASVPSWDEIMFGGGKHD